MLVVVGRLSAGWDGERVVVLWWEQTGGKERRRRGPSFIPSTPRRFAANAKIS